MSLAGRIPKKGKCMKIAIDGPAGCGKSTIARLIADNLGFLYINSGNFYRAIAYLSIQEKVAWQDASAMIRLVKAHRFDYVADGSVVVDDKKLSSELRSLEVDAIVSQVSAIPEIREQVNAIIRSIAQSKDVVSEGRDISTVVFPDADLKLYLDASIKIRAERRYLEKTRALQAESRNSRTFCNNEIENATFDEIMKNIEMRDVLDKQKAVGALKIAKDAVYLDTSDLTIEQVYEKVYKILKARIAHVRK